MMMFPLWNISMIERNEVNKNSKGGTELMADGLVKYVDSSLLDHFQIIPSRVREISKDKLPILWLHDLPGDPESQKLKDPEYRKQFKKIVFVSHWQQQMYNAYLGVPYSEGVVLRNAIDPIEPEFVDKKDPDGKVRLIYHPTPHRGLEILVPVVKELVKVHPEVHLDVYSSFKLYGWPERDAQYKRLFEEIENHPNMTYHGSVSQEELRKAIGKAHIFSYPSIWQETSCLCAIEAMSGGCYTVTSTLAALPETCANFGILYPYTENVNDHANRFFSTLEATVRMAKTYGYQGTVVQKPYFDLHYSWQNRKSEWEHLLQTLLKE